MGTIFRAGLSYRLTFDSGLRHVLLGLVPGPRASIQTPRLVALEPHADGSPPLIDPVRVRKEVMRAVRDTEESTGIAVSLEVIEYVPNDSPYYEKYYSLARNLLLAIAREG
jgi:hypothetical protein